MEEELLPKHITNEEIRKLYNKLYYLKNKDKIINDACTKIECEICGKFTIKNNYKRHLKSKVCMNRAYLNTLLENNKEILKNNEKLLNQISTT